MNPSRHRSNSGSACSSRLLGCLIIVTLSVATGCGNRDRPKTIAVEGLITFDGQAPEYPGALFFAPLEVAEGYPRRPGRALFDLDGTFTATSFDPGDGLVPGTYRVRVESWKKPPAMGSPGISYVPKGFEARDLIVSEEERRVRYDLDVSSR